MDCELGAVGADDSDDLEQIRAASRAKIEPGSGGLFFDRQRIRYGVLDVSVVNAVPASRSVNLHLRIVLRNCVQVGSTPWNRGGLAVGRAKAPGTDSIIVAREGLRGAVDHARGRVVEWHADTRFGT
jgi:hypothetical protein